MLPQPLPCCLQSSGRLLSLPNPVLQQHWAESCRLHYPPGLRGVEILAITGCISSTLKHLPSQGGSVQAAWPDNLLSRALLEQSSVYSLLEICQPHIQPKIWGSSPWSGCSVTLPERESPCQSWLCCSGKLQVCDQRSSSQHSISEMSPWHNLSETLLLQPLGIPIRSHPGLETPPFL